MLLKVAYQMDRTNDLINLPDSELLAAIKKDLMCKLVNKMDEEGLFKMSYTVDYPNGPVIYLSVRAYHPDT